MFEVYQQTRPSVTRQEWDYTVMERFAIMHLEGGIEEPEAKTMAYHDTVTRLGRRPKE